MRLQSDINEVLGEIFLKSNPFDLVVFEYSTHLLFARVFEA